VILQPQRVTFSVTVSSGTGTASFTANGRLDDAYVEPPSGSPTIDFEIQDANGKTRGARAGVITKAFIKLNSLCLGINSFIISNASADGLYTVTIYWDFGV